MTGSMQRVTILAVVFGLIALALAALSVDAAQESTPAPEPTTIPEPPPPSSTPGSTPIPEQSAGEIDATPTATGAPIATGDAPFTLTTTPAFGGTFKIGDWLPINVTIENHGPDTHVEIRATTGPSGSATTFVVPIDLPAGTRKSATLYTLPEALPRTFDVVAVETDGDAATAAEVRVNPLFQTDTLCGVGGYPEGSLAALGRVQAAGGQPGMGIPDSPVSVVPIDLATFPTVAEGLASFDCIVIGGNDSAATLGPEAQAALTSWVHRGGQLIVATGERWQSAVASIPAGLLPVTVDGSRTIENLAPLVEIAGEEPPAAAAIAAVAAIPDDLGSSIIAASGDLPLVVERPAGDGRVTFLAFDPDAAPIAEWDGADDLWKGLLRTRVGQEAWRGLPPDINPRQMETAPLVGALSQIPALDLPSIKLLAALLGAYLLVVSPLNYLVLRRFNKLSWAWASTLVLVGVFALATYGAGSRIRGSDVIVNTISIVQGDGATDGPVRARTFVGLFSPSKSSYEVDVGDPTGNAVLLSTMPPSADPWSGTSSSGGGTLVQGATAQVRDLGVSQWASRFFMAEHQPADAPRVVATLNFDGDALRGTVTNPSTVPLRDCTVFVGMSIVMLGDLAPGETKQVDLDLSNVRGNPNGMPLSMLLLGVNPNGNWPDLSNDRELRMRQMILDTMYGYGFNGPISPTGVNFVGWSDAPLVPITVKGQRVATVDTLLLTSRLPATFGADDSGTVGIPAGVITPVMSTSDADSAFSTGSDIQVFGGSAEFDFTIPSEARPTAVTNLTLHFPAGGGGMMGPLPESVQIFDWEAGQFVDLPDYTGNVTLENPGRYLDPDRGFVRLKITAGVNNPSYLTIHVSLEGTREIAQ